MLTYWITPALKWNRRRAAACLEQLLEIGGWRSTEVADFAAADIAYGLDASSETTIPFAGVEAWNGIRDQESVAYEEFRVPSSTLLCHAGAPAVDPVLAAYFFLSGQLEYDDRVRMFAGIPEEESVAEWGLHHPIVQRLVSVVAARVPRAREPRPLWPPGKTWAMCLTHDCDRLLRYRFRGFLREAFRKDSSARQRVISASKALYSSLHHWSHLDPYEASLFAWLAFEREMGVKGVYYVGTWSRSDNHSHKYDLVHGSDDPETLRLVKACREHGAEIGLHSGIEAWRDPARYAEETKRFVESYGVRPLGVRGHYWSLNAANPEESLRFAAHNGGLKYSSCFGMNVSYGFRRGTCYPFRPFDADSGVYAGILEVPPTVMDGGLYVSAETNEERLENFVILADRVMKANGVFVLDWHSDSLWRGFMGNMTAPLLGAISDIIADSTCWVTTAAEVAEWCIHARWSGA